MRSRPLFATAAAGMFVFGLVMALLGAILPLLSEKLRFDLARAGVLFVVMNAAMLGTMLALGPLMDRFGKKPPLVAGPVLVTVALWGIAAAVGFGGLLSAVALLGIGGGALNGATNTLTADLYDEPAQKNSALNLLGVFFGIGAVFIPFAIGTLLGVLGLARILQVAALLALAPAIPAAILVFPPPRLRLGVPLGHVARLARHPLVLAFAILLFFQSGNEFTLGGFAATYLTRELALDVRTASYVLALFWAGVILARVALSRLLLRVPGDAVVLASAVASAAAMLVVVAARSTPVSVIALLAAGVAMASIFPTTLGLAASRFPDSSGTVFGILFAVALAGGMTLPWLTAQLGQAYGLRAALLLPALAFLVILGLTRFVRPAPGAPGFASSPGGSV